MSINRPEPAQEPKPNPGRIEPIASWPGWVWRTVVGPFELQLHIISLGSPEPGAPEGGIASFVVMEQEQPFLDYVAGLVADAIADYARACPGIILVTVESKGSHFVPWVWRQLAERQATRLCGRIITLRKSAKAYMKTPGMPDSVASLDNHPVVLHPIAYESITSPEEQRLVISPKDAGLLYDEVRRGTEPILVDDFLGAGGTAVGVYRLFESLNHQIDYAGGGGLRPPRVVAVIGSDSGLYTQSFAREGIDYVVLPRQLPLRLPTFTRETADHPWKIAG
ncbi:MAG: hypothetical protein GX620_10440 [Chloroflexi bacterium]|nr:hypothetical protein [Chloroflexota bacterium]